MLLTDINSTMQYFVLHLLVSAPHTVRRAFQQIQGKRHHFTYSHYLNDKGFLRGRIHEYHSDEPLSNKDVDQNK